jgi:hypothetical protein
MAAAISPAVPSVPATPAQGGGALKLVLIIAAAIVVVGIVGIGTLIFVVRRVAHNTHIQNQDGKVRVETPFGTVQSTNNPDEASRNLGIDLYPGARLLKGNSATMGGMHTVQAEFESQDSAEKVMSFYSSKFPQANVTTRDQDHYTIVSTDKGNLVTIKIEPEDGKTRIKIANVAGRNVTGDSSSD